MIVELLNAQTNLLWEWRSRLVELLTRSVSYDSGEDADGKEYARSLETQREAETFLDAYSVLLNDRREALFAEKSLLAAHDGRGRFKRATLAAMRALGQEVYPDDDDDDDDEEEEEADYLPEAWQEDQALKQDLTQQRLILLESFQGRALKSITTDLTNFHYSHGGKLGSVAGDAASSLRSLISSQSKFSFFFFSRLNRVKQIPVRHNDKLYADLVHFRRAFKERVL